MQVSNLKKIDHQYGKTAAIKKNNADTHHLKCSHLDWLICQEGVPMPMQRLIRWAPLLKKYKVTSLDLPLASCMTRMCERCNRKKERRAKREEGWESILQFTTISVPFSNINPFPLFPHKNTTSILLPPTNYTQTILL